MSASRLENRIGSRSHSSIEPIKARLEGSDLTDEALPHALRARLARFSAPPLAADAAVIVLASEAPQSWRAIVWSRHAEARIQSLPAPAPRSWLWNVVERGEHWLEHVDGEARGGFPWLPEARSWLAVPLEDGTGRRIGAVAVAAESEREWGAAAERRLVQLIGEAAADLERVWLKLELTRVQAKLAQARRAEANACERRDTMLAALGHELRNPLAPLINALELLLTRAPPELNGELSVMDRQLRQLRRLVDDLLDLSRVFRDDLALDLRRVRLLDVVLAAADNVRSMISEREHTLSADVAAELVLQADEARLTQVVTALLSNAARHTPRGRRIHLSACSLGDRIELSVADDGGMDAGVLETAFEPFHGRRSQGLGAGGLGLGLPIARALAARHGGDLWLESEGPSCGTLAVLRLPKSGSVPPPASEPRAKKSSFGIPKNVLIVDDNHDAADMLADAIRGWGGRVTVAYDSIVALKLAEATRFDVALVDIAMPEMNGLELASELRRLPSTRELHIIAISGFGEPSDAERSLEAGMDAHLVKPIGLGDLWRVLTELPRQMPGGQGPVMG